MAELTNDERTRMLYESRQKMEWDIRARERETTKAIARKLLSRGRPIDEIIEDTGLTREEIDGLRNAN